MMPKATAFKLALCSAALSVLFAYWRVYVCLGAAFLLLLIFDGIWATKLRRDQRLARKNSQYRPPEPPLPLTSSRSTRLFVPK